MRLWRKNYSSTARRITWVTLKDCFKKHSTQAEELCLPRTATDLEVVRVWYLVLLLTMAPCKMVLLCQPVGFQMLSGSMRSSSAVFCGFAYGRPELPLERSWKLNTWLLVASSESWQRCIKESKTEKLSLLWTFVVGTSLGLTQMVFLYVYSKSTLQAQIVRPGEPQRALFSLPNSLRAYTLDYFGMFSTRNYIIEPAKINNPNKSSQEHHRTPTSPSLRWFWSFGRWSGSFCRSSRRHDREASQTLHPLRTLSSFGAPHRNSIDLSDLHLQVSASTQRQVLKGRDCLGSGQRLWIAEWNDIIYITILRCSM